MNISAPFIQRPIATALLMVGLLVGGLVAYPLLPVASLPNVNYPTLQVTTQLPAPIRRPWHPRWRPRSNCSSGKSQASPR
jgi:hypothetical protein